MPVIDEPLALSAPLAWQWAPAGCGDKGCSWNHKLWQCLRLMGLGGSPQINAAFYARAFRTVAPECKSPRIMISGAADYAMLAHVFAGFAQQGRNAQVTVVDLCDTPLRLNRWYAGRLSQSVDTVCCDVAAFAGRDFDAICTHAFLGQIPPARRAAVTAAWFRTLRAGGKVITVDRARPDATRAAIGFTDEQRQAFMATVTGMAPSVSAQTGIAAGALIEAAHVYLAHQQLHPVRSSEESRALFEQAGFVLDELSEAPNEISSVSSNAGPAIPSKALYVHVIARRP